MKDVFLAFVSGAVLAWGFAHGEVARECTMLGRFYVNEKIFECKQVEAKK